MKKYFLLLIIASCGNLKNKGNEYDANKKIEQEANKNRESKNQFTIVDEIDMNDTSPAYEVSSEDNIAKKSEEARESKIAEEAEKRAVDTIDNVISLIEKNKKKFKEMETKFLNELTRLDITRTLFKFILNDVINIIIKKNIEDIDILCIQDIEKILKNIDHHLMNAEKSITTKYVNNKGAIGEIIGFISETFREKISVFNTLLSTNEIFPFSLKKETTTTSIFDKDATIAFIKDLQYYNMDDIEGNKIHNLIKNTRKRLVDDYNMLLSF